MERIPVWFMAALGAIVLAAVIGVVALLASGDDGDEPARNAMPEASASPEATTAPSVRSGCDAWPEEIAPIFEGGQLSVPEGICLRTADEPAEMPEGCRADRACYRPSDSTVWRLSEAGEALLPPAAEGGSADFVLARELCHAHQMLQVTEERPGDTALASWPLTEEGEAYLALSDQLPPGFTLIPNGPVESFANVCAAWLLPNELQRATLVLPHVPLVNLLQTTLPE